MRTFFSVIISLGLGLSIFISDIAYADKVDHIGRYRNWEAFTVERDNGTLECYMISVPTDTNPKNVRRGDIYVMVTHRPRVEVWNEVNVQVGYPFRENSEATVTIGNTQVGMFTEGQGAWARTPRADQQLTDAMKRGNTMVVRGTSSRGTNTRDVYSLLGFTAANEAITRACRN